MQVPYKILRLRKNIFSFMSIAYSRTKSNEIHKLLSELRLNNGHLSLTLINPFFNNSHLTNLSFKIDANLFFPFLEHKEFKYTINYSASIVLFKSFVKFYLL